MDQCCNTVECSGGYEECRCKIMRVLDWSAPLLPDRQRSRGVGDLKKEDIFNVISSVRTVSFSFFTNSYLDDIQMQPL